MNPLFITLPQNPISYSIDYDSSFDVLTKAITSETRSFAVVFDENVFQKSDFFAPFQNNIPENFLMLPAGEEHKTWNTIEKIIAHFFHCGLDRSSVVFAVGGGVVGDMVGFASSLFMRGIPFIQVPTTVLSMVDSSVGGKTGVDTPHGKNLIGSFHQPERVIICQSFLDSLPFEEVQNGFAEMVKHSIVANRFFEDLEAFGKHFSLEFAQKNLSPDAYFSLFQHIQESVLVKKDIVEADEKEHGIRAWLNLGHTFGHAIELLSDFQIPHGLGVAKGIVLALQMAEQKGILEEHDLLARTAHLFENVAMDISCPYAFEELLPAMQHDKKKKAGIIRFVLPKKRGEMVMISI